MQVFVTGATGWVGTAVVGSLLDAGHAVVGLSRSETKGAALAARGARVIHATLDDLDALADAARAADAVIHLGFSHDFARFDESAAQDRRAIEALGAALAGSGKPLLVTSGVALIAPGRVATEADPPADDPSFPRRSEQAAAPFAGQGVRAAAVRLSPSVHGVGEAHGFVPTLVNLAREKGVSAYIGDGANRWPAVHVSDAGRLYRLALEHDVDERVYHAVAEEGIPFRHIAEAIGRKLGVPVASREPGHFGWLARFAGADVPASAARTRERLGWRPTGPTLLDDIARPEYGA